MTTYEELDQLEELDRRCKRLNQINYEYRELVAALEEEIAELKRLNEVMPCGHLLRYSWPPDGDSGTTRLCLECEIRDCGSVIYSEFESDKSIVDDFGGVWPRYCEKCGAPNIIVRPGDCRCSKECYR